MRTKGTIWHDATEEAAKETKFLGKCRSGYWIYDWGYQYDSWQDLCADEGLEKWCYISDIEKL